MDELRMKPIARIHTDFPEKFGIPRQSGLVDSLTAEIVMEPEYRVMDAFRGIEGFSYLWLLWHFSESDRESWSPTVRPPRLGGNTRRGVFATRSPFRPNAIGLSCVKLRELRLDAKLGPVLTVSGADLMDGTPILDIKPYHPGADCHPDASAGFIPESADYRLEVLIPPEYLEMVPASKQDALRGILAEDPRPSFHRDPERIYGLSFAGLSVRFRVEEKRLTVVSVTPLPEQNPF